MSKKLQLTLFFSGLLCGFQSLICLGQISAQTVYCSPTLELSQSELSFLEIVAYALQRGLLDINRLEEMMESETLINSFHPQTLAERPYYLAVNELLPDCSWNRLEPYLRDLMQMRTEERRKVSRDERETKGILNLKKKKVEPAQTPYGPIKLLLEIEGPNGISVLMALIGSERNKHHLRTYHPVRGAGETAYSINGVWSQKPILFKKEGELYLGIVLKDRIEVFLFNLDKVSSKQVKPLYDIPYPIAEEKTEDNILEPLEEVKVFYQNEQPVFYYQSRITSTVLTWRRVFLSLELNQISNERSPESSLQIKDPDIEIKPVVIHQERGLPPLFFTDSGQAFRVAPPPSWSELTQEHVSFSAIGSPVHEGSNHYFPSDVNTEILDEEKIYIYQIIYFPGSGGRNFERPSFIGIYYTKSGAYELIKTPTGTKIYTPPLILKSGGKNYLVALLGDRRNEPNSRATLFFYDLSEKKWLEREVDLAFTLNLGKGTHFFRNGEPLHMSRNFLKKIKFKGREYLLIRSQEDNQKTQLLALYDFEEDHILNQIQVSSSRRVSEPYLYSDDTGTALLLLNRNTKDGSTELIHITVIEGEKAQW